MPLAIHPITKPWARAASAWRYPAPYDLYDHEPDDWQRLLLPAYRYHAVLDAGDLTGDDPRDFVLLINTASSH